MKSANKRHLAHSIVEDGTVEGLKKRARDLGLIVNAGRTAGSIELQTRTTRKLDPKVRHAAEGEMGGKKKGSNR